MGDWLFEFGVYGECNDYWIGSGKVFFGAIMGSKIDWRRGWIVGYFGGWKVKWYVFMLILLNGAKFFVVWYDSVWKRVNLGWWMWN